MNNHILILLLTLFPVAALGFAQVAQEKAIPAVQEERLLVNAIPSHVPIKVKLKNEKVFKDVHNKRWMRDLEFELRNVGANPIYFVALSILMPDFVVKGQPLAKQIQYGRPALADVAAPTLPEDVPILPGESYTFKLPEAQIKEYETVRDTGKLPDAKKVELYLKLINFGDGTGLVGSPRSSQVRTK